MENFNIEEIRKLREQVEALRRDIARLDGRLDTVEKLAENAFGMADSLTTEFIHTMRKAEADNV